MCRRMLGTTWSKLYRQVKLTIELHDCTFPFSRVSSSIENLWVWVKKCCHWVESGIFLAVHHVYEKFWLTDGWDGSLGSYLFLAAEVTLLLGGSSDIYECYPILIWKKLLVAYASKLSFHGMVLIGLMVRDCGVYQSIHVELISPWKSSFSRHQWKSTR